MTKTPESLGEEQIAYTARVLERVDLRDAGEYKIGMAFKGFGWAEFQGDRIFMKPSWAQEIQDTFLQSGEEGLREIGKGQNGQTLVNLHKILSEHPLILAYDLGCREKLSAEYDGSRLLSGCGTTAKRSVSPRDINLALASGAIFGNVNDKSLQGCENAVLSAMKTGNPSFRSVLYGLWCGSGGQTLDPADTSTEYSTLETELFHIFTHRDEKETEILNRAPKAREE